jgi:hypothetical protein
MLCLSDNFILHEEGQLLHELGCVIASESVEVILEAVEIFQHQVYGGFGGWV